MSRTILLLVSIAACGSAPAPATTPPPTSEKASPPEPEPAAAAKPEPAPAQPTAPAAPLSVHDRLRDFEGPVAGLAGFSIKRTPSADHCGGIKITVTRAKTVAPADKHLAAVYALAFPANLSFDPDPAKKAVREASMKKFEAFVQTLTTTGRDAAKFYAGQIPGGDAPTKLAALARVVQVQFQVVSVLARAEIPKDVRTGELKEDQIAAYCDNMTEVSEPLLVQAEAALASCATFVMQGTAGWWTEVCKSK
jgi:hypothetical protein